MILEKTLPVARVRAANRNPRRTAAAETSSDRGLRRARYAAAYPAATRKARVAVQAQGTWKKTIREDSPMKPCAGFGHRKAAPITAVMYGSRRSLSARI